MDFCSILMPYNLKVETHACNNIDQMLADSAIIVLC